MNEKIIEKMMLCRLGYCVKSYTECTYLVSFDTVFRMKWGIYDAMFVYPGITADYSPKTHGNNLIVGVEYFKGH